MKRLFCALISAFALIGFTSCIGGGSGYDDPFTDNPGGGNHRGDNGSGGNSGSGSGSGTSSVFPGDQTYKLMADAVYYGSQNYSEVDEYILYLYWGEYDSNDDFKSVGTELAFDVLCPKTGKMELSSGTYKCASDDYTQYHFLDGIDKDGEIYPSYAYYKSSSSSKVVVISAGTIEISTSGSTKNITVTFKAESPDSKTVQTYKVKFSGEIAYTDGRSAGSGTPKEVEMKSFSKVTAEYWGQEWLDNDKKPLAIDDWILYLYGENYDQDKEYVTIEIFTAPGSKTLAQGIYNDIAVLGHIDQFKPGAVLSGYVDDNDKIAYGTWYCKGGTAYYAATKGQLAVAAKNDLYSLTFDFVDEDETYGGSFKGSYTGKIEVVDKSVQTKAGARRGSVMESIAKTAPRRNADASRRTEGR